MFVAPGTDTARKREKAAKSVLPADAAMASGFPVSALPIETTAAAFFEPGRSEATVLLWSRIAPGITPGQARPVAYRVSAFDAGWHDRATDRQRVSMTATTSDARGTIGSALHLEPGRYELRVAADSEGRSGSLFTDLEIPDFARDHFAVSGLLAGPMRTPAAVSGVPDVPVAPAVSRRFRRDDAAAAFLRVYQRTGKAEAVTVRVTVADERGGESATESVTLDAAAFSPGGSADFVYRLPTDRLGPGEYLLTITFARGASQVRRTMTFRLEP
jgi:hypothetical protein